MKKRLNIPQLIDSISQQLEFYDEMLNGTIRTIGLREKIIHRKKALVKCLNILNTSEKTEQSEVNNT